MLTTAHADRGRPTLKDDERFRNGLVRDLNEFTMNAKLFMNAKSIYMNAKRTKLNTNINLKIMLYESCLMSLDCSNAVNRTRSTKNVDEVIDLQVALTGKHDAVLILHEQTRYMNAVWKYVKCIEVLTVIRCNIYDLFYFCLYICLLWYYCHAK